MKRVKSFCGALVLILLSIPSFSQSVLVPYCAAPTIDGSIKAREWQDADTFNISINTTRATSVYMMHDTSHLYFAFVGNLQTGGNYFPEVLIDPNNDTSTTFLADDWWFHVSGTDCESKGAYGIYNNCKRLQSDWTAVPNFINHGPVVDTVEIKISLQKLGLTISDTFRVGLLLNNFRTKKIYPSGASHLNPLSWKEMYFTSTTSVENENREFSQLEVFPNPTRRFLNIKTGKDKIWTGYRIMDIAGKVISEGAQFNDNRIDLSRHFIKKGLYLITLFDSDGREYTKRFVFNE